MGYRSRTEKITSIIESVSDAIFALDSEGTVTAWNDAASELFGYSAPETVSYSIEDILTLHDGNRQKVNSLLGQSGSNPTNESEKSVQITATRASGESIRVELTRIETKPTILRADRIDQPTDTTTEAEFFDVSTYRLAIERSTDLIAATDQNERLLFANERYRNFHGLDDQVSGMQLETALSSNLYSEIKPRILQVLDGETIRFEMERLGPDGTNHVFNVQYFPLETKQGEIKGAVGTMREITELKRQARSLRESWETYRDLIQGIPHPIILHETDGDIIEVNEAASRFFECKEEELLGKNLRELLVSDRAIRPFNRLERGDSDEEFFETECRTTNDAIIPVDIATTRVDYFGTEAILTVARDISEQKAYERELERTNAGLEEFAAVVSQDLRNPLTVANGWADIARERESIEPLEQISESLERMDHVIDYTLTLAREGEGLGQRSEIDLETLVQNCWKAVETGEETLETDVDLTIRGDRGRVGYLFERLFENCTKLNRANGAIRVGELTGKTGFFVEIQDADLPDEIDEIESSHIGSTESLDCDLVVVERVANAHGWRMRLVTDDSRGVRLRFSGVEVAENQ